MKKRMSFTFDKETVDLINLLIDEKNYRNRSHLVEKAIISLVEKELKLVKENE